ncbi:hypothetical protein BCR39DRAFT_539399 [Naematelia encephala]|uniref:Uncharacterized protein n=1 Tax=Naematelia encephala TaxID=71784 RepID=A0A1Y2AWL9_9TREE|nr:hypothetical protein BCR39DRAFT_539399 [Naematelia encephala]
MPGPRSAGPAYIPPPPRMDRRSSGPELSTRPANAPSPNRRGLTIAEAMQSILSLRRTLPSDSARRSPARSVHETLHESEEDEIDPDPFAAHNVVQRIPPADPRLSPSIDPRSPSSRINTPDLPLQLGGYHYLFPDYVPPQQPAAPSRRGSLADVAAATTTPTTRTTSPSRPQLPPRRTGSYALPDAARVNPRTLADTTLATWPPPTAARDGPYTATLPGFNPARRASEPQTQPIPPEFPLLGPTFIPIQLPPGSTTRQISHDTFLLAPLQPGPPTRTLGDRSNSEPPTRSTPSPHQWREGDLATLQTYQFPRVGSALIPVFPRRRTAPHIHMAPTSPAPRRSSSPLRSPLDVDDDPVAPSQRRPGDQRQQARRRVSGAGLPNGAMRHTHIEQIRAQGIALPHAMGGDPELSTPDAEIYERLGTGTREIRHTLAEVVGQRSPLLSIPALSPASEADRRSTTFFERPIEFTVPGNGRPPRSAPTSATRPVINGSNGERSAQPPSDIPSASAGEPVEHDSTLDQAFFDRFRYDGIEDETFTTPPIEQAATFPDDDDQDSSNGTTITPGTARAPRTRESTTQSDVSMFGILNSGPTNRNDEAVTLEESSEPMRRDRTQSPLFGLTEALSITAPMNGIGHDFDQPGPPFQAAEFVTSALQSVETLSTGNPETEEGLKAIFERAMNESADALGWTVERGILPAQGSLRARYEYTLRDREGNEMSREVPEDFFPDQDGSRRVRQTTAEGMKELTELAELNRRAAAALEEEEAAAQEEAQTRALQHISEGVAENVTGIAINVVAGTPTEPPSSLMPTAQEETDLDDLDYVANPLLSERDVNEPLVHRSASPTLPTHSPTEQTQLPESSSHGSAQNLAKLSSESATPHPAPGMPKMVGPSSSLLPRTSRPVSPEASRDQEERDPAASQSGEASEGQESAKGKGREEGKKEKKPRKREKSG